MVPSFLLGESPIGEEIRHLLTQSEHRIREAISLFDSEYGVRTVERERRIRMLEISLHEYLARCLIQKFLCSRENNDDDDDDNALDDGDDTASIHSNRGYNATSQTERQFQEMCRELDYSLKILKSFDNHDADHNNVSDLDNHRAMYEYRMVLKCKVNILFHFAHILEQWGFQRRERYEALCEQSKEKYMAAIRWCESDTLRDTDLALFLRSQMAKMMLTWCRRARLMSLIYTSKRNFGRSGNASTMKGVGE